MKRGAGEVERLPFRWERKDAPFDLRCYASPLARSTM